MFANNPIVWLVVLVLISTVVGAIAKMLNNLAEANAARRAEDERRRRVERSERAAERVRAAQDERAERPRPLPPAAQPAAGGGPVRPAGSDMDRFLAEIDRLRRKQAGVPEPTAQPGSSPPAAPVVQPTKPPPERPRSRTMADLIDAPAGTPTGGAPSFGTSPQAPTRSAPVAAQVEELPAAQTQRAASATGAPVTKVTRFANRPRPASRTNFGKNLTALLGSGQGVAMAVVLQEVLGPPKAKKNANAEKQS
jgi:hypothetical protein